MDSIVSLTKNVETMKEVVIAYQQLQKNLSGVIDKSGFETDYIAKRIGMAPGRFHAKKERGSWSDNDMLKILSIVEDEETEDYLLGQLIEESKHDEVASIDELKAVLSA